MSGFRIKLSNSSSWLRHAGHSIEEEAIIYDTLLQDVYENPRWYLDNLDYLCEFRVRWANYRQARGVIPYKFVKK